RHPDERQVANALADDLVPGGEGDQVGEALEGDAIPRTDETRDRFVEPKHAGQPTIAAGRVKRLPAQSCDNRLHVPRSSMASDPDFRLSLARGLAVIRAFGEGKPQQSIREIALATGVSRAAARRCLHTLITLGYATGHDGVYELTPATLSLASNY